MTGAASSADPDEKIPVGLSYSGGTSSEWALQAVLHGVIPRPDNFAVFSAHTGIEHLWTYDAMERVKETCRKEGVPFFEVRRREFLDDHLITASLTGATRAETPPLYVAKDGGGRGQIAARCTREFKIAPMRRGQSEWLKSLGKPKKIIKWIGFGADEVGRAVKATGKQDVQWERLDFPAIRLRMSRDAQRAQMASWGIEAPRFSMCTICPHKTPSRWAATPESQRARVIEVDEAIRDLSACGVTDGEAFLSDALIPVSRLFKKVDAQARAGESEAMMDQGCDGGHCFL
jgi:hypothetical protein